MKIILEHWRGDKQVSLEEALEDKLTPDAYSYEDKNEKLEQICQLQSEMLVALITKLNLTNDSLEDILGYGFQVED